MRVSDEDLRRLQLTQLAILVDVDALCERHGIRYVLLGGTALGSRRHRGFIPWDDDIDIGMLRADFERFLEVGRAELPQSLYIQYWLDDPHMGAPFAKIRRNGTRFVEASSSETGGHKGVSIDLFPFDNVPDGPAEQPWKAELKFWRRVLRHQTGYSMRRLPLALRLADMPARITARLIGQARAKRRLHKLMTRYRDRKAERVLAVGGAYDFRKDMLKADWLTDRVPQPFEGREFPCPRELDAYLTHMYGDFMRLPPPDERRNKHVIVELSFE